jgi:hypothetical protein
VSNYRISFTTAAGRVAGEQHVAGRRSNVDLGAMILLFYISLFDFSLSCYYAIDMFRKNLFHH